MFCKRILSPFTGRKKRKTWSKTSVKYMPAQRRQNLAETDKRNSQKNFQTVKVDFTMAMKVIVIMRVSNENNEQQQLPRVLLIDATKQSQNFFYRK